MGEIIDLGKEDNPTIIGCVVVANLFESVVSLWRQWDWEVLFDLLFWGHNWNLQNIIDNDVSDIVIWESFKFMCYIII